MNKMKSLILSCLSMMLCMTISAQTVSFVPNWKKGDKASFYYEKKETDKTGDETLNVKTTFVLNLKVVNKDANGYTINASFEDPKITPGSEEENALLLKKYKVSFDYKLDATGKLIGFADSTKVIAEIKKLYKMSDSDDSMVSFLYGLIGALSPEIYLSELMEEVVYIHALNEINLESKKNVEIKKEKRIALSAYYKALDIPSTYKYTLESVKKNITNVKCSTILTNEDIKTAYIEDGIKTTSSILDDPYIFQDEDYEDRLKTLIQERRAEYEEEYKESYDLNITDTFNYSFDNSSKWLNSLSATYTTKGKKEGKDVSDITEITISKK